MLRVCNGIIGTLCIVLSVTNFMFGNIGLASFDLFIGIGNLCCVVMPKMK